MGATSIMTTDPAAIAAKLGANHWPNGCLKPSGCERRKACGYVGCPHSNRDIAAEVQTAVRAVLEARGD